MPLDTNDKYFQIHGYGCGTILSGDESAVLRTLTDKQVEALLALFLLGDVYEAPFDADLAGTWWLPSKQTGEEEELRLSFAAALVYLSGRVASDFRGFMLEPRVGMWPRRAWICDACGASTIETEPYGDDQPRPCPCGGTKRVFLGDEEHSVGIAHESPVQSTSDAALA